VKEVFDRHFREALAEWPTLEHGEACSHAAERAGEEIGSSSTASQRTSTGATSRPCNKAFFG
jgi:hypothetical protein